jgi:Alpha/beta hydrolase family
MCAARCGKHAAGRVNHRPFGNQDLFGTDRGACFPQASQSVGPEDHPVARRCPVVVAGHAYAGAVIASTSSEKVASLVYVTALAPDEGETVGDVYYWAEHHPEAPVLGPDRHGLIWLPEEAFSRAFAQHASPLEQALLAATRRPMAPACISVPVRRPLWKDQPSWFLVAEEDRMIPAETQRFMAERMKARVRRTFLRVTSTTCSSTSSTSSTASPMCSASAASRCTCSTTVRRSDSGSLPGPVLSSRAGIAGAGG